MPRRRASSPARALVQPGRTVFGTPVGHAGAPVDRSSERNIPQQRSSANARSRETADGEFSDLTTALRLSPLPRPTTPTSGRRGGSPSEVWHAESPAESPDSPSHLHEDWFTSKGFSPTRSPQSSPSRIRSSHHHHHEQQDGIRKVAHRTPRSTCSRDYVSAELTVSGDVRGLSLAVVSLNISPDVDRSGMTSHAHGSAEADAWYMGLRDAVRTAAYCAVGNGGLHSTLVDSSTGSASTTSLISHQLKQQLESREHLIFKESANHTKGTLQVNVDLRACSTRRFCDSLVFVLFDSSMCTEPDFWDHRCASNGRFPTGSQRPTLTRKAQTAVTRNGCGGQMVEVLYTQDDALSGSPKSPYRGGIRVGGGFKHLSPPEVKTLEDRVRAKDIQVTVRCHADGHSHDDVCSDELSVACVVKSREWTGAVLMHAQPQSAQWDDLLERVRARKERRGALVIQAVCRRMIERQRFFAHRYLRDGHQHMAVQQWELASATFKSALRLRCIDSMVPALQQALHSACDSCRRRDLAREEVCRLLLEGNAHADAREAQQAVSCYVAASAVRGLEDQALTTKLEHLRWELSEGTQVGASTAMEMTRLHARACVLEGNTRLAEGQLQAATDAYQAAVQLAHTLNYAQSSNYGLNSNRDQLMQEVLEAIADAHTYLKSSSLPCHEVDP